MSGPTPLGAGGGRGDGGGHLQGRGRVRELLAAHGHHPNKRLGQHFLADPNLVDRIVRTAGIGPGDRVVEIGAGTGALTVAIAATGAHVVAYEIDRHLGPVLAEALREAPAPGGVELRFEQASVGTLGQGLDGDGWVLVANLPYNIGASLVLDLLRAVPAVDRFVVMVQREVAERLAADPGSRRYGLPAVIARLRGEVTWGFPVPAEVFLPRPEVASAVVTIARRIPPAVVDRAEALAGAAFRQRRKMLRRSLAGVLPDPEATLRCAGIDPATRPESLPPEAFVRLAEVAG